MTEEPVLFGSQQSFGIDVEDNHVEDGHVCAHLCFWAGGERIGDGNVEWLTIPTADLEYSLSPDHPSPEKLYPAMGPAEILELVYTPSLGLSQKNAPLLLVSGPPFDGWYVILYKGQREDTLAWRTSEEDDVHQVQLPKGVYESAVREYLAWFYAECRRQGIEPFPEDAPAKPELLPPPR
ncbi:MAG: hypothetical protein ABSH20_05875 [Tepidisphaeraceae bacterium]|jgi:hypothetical protein